MSNTESAIQVLRECCHIADLHDSLPMRMIKGKLLSLWVDLESTPDQSHRKLFDYGNMYEQQYRELTSQEKIEYADNIRNSITQSLKEYSDNDKHVKSLNNENI